MNEKTTALDVNAAILIHVLLSDVCIFVLGMGSVLQFLNLVVSLLEECEHGEAMV